MKVRNQKQRSVELHDFAMSPSPEVPRSVFNLSHGKKMAFNFSDLIPILVEPAMPGDTWSASVNLVARTAVPIVPVQDNWRINFFSFFVPMRLVWDDARKFWGEQDNPGDSINFTIPQIVSNVGGFTVGSMYDYMGLPTAGQIAGGATISINALPARCYSLIYSEWFRDENLQNYASISKGPGPDAANSYPLRQRNKRFDYITQALPWPQKGNTAISLPIGVAAPVKTQATANVLSATDGIQWRSLAGTAPAVNQHLMVTTAATNNPNMKWSTTAATAGAGDFLYPANLYADLAGATGTTLNAFRTAVAMQQYLERDARMGTRYTEFVWGMYRVRTADARLNRPEFIGAGGGDILTTAIPQTSATGLTGGTTPAGNLAATGSAQASGGFTYSVTEHGYILTLACATIDLTYQQGLRKMWSVQTRYDFPVPLLANLGEQALLNKEVYCVGTPAQDDAVFGYVPRWDEYRSIPSQISGIYRSTSAGTIDYWHSSQRFTALPTLNSTFITDDAKTVVQRNFAAGASSLGQQLLTDIYWNIRCTRPLPLYGIPGLTRL